MLSLFFRVHSPPFNSLFFAFDKKKKTFNLYVVGSLFFSLGHSMLDHHLSFSRLFFMLNMKKIALSFS
jgi:hypothetical protein